jgi:streptomycin 6-kinase
MLKIAPGEEEQRGAHLMAWWAGAGAARVFERDGEALLLERAQGARSLAAMARGGEDDRAGAILCQAAARLHAPRAAAAPDILVPLDIWFRALPKEAARRGGVLAPAARVAGELLAAPSDRRPLHGDLHHDNVLDGGARGWLAIDPKGLIGERGFDYANIFCNPDAATATAAFAARLALIAGHAGIARERLLRWILAWSGLSAAWTLVGGGEAGGALAIAALAAGELQIGWKPMS